MMCKVKKKAASATGNITKKKQGKFWMCLHFTVFLLEKKGAFYLVRPGGFNLLGICVQRSRFNGALSSSRVVEF